MVLKIYGFSLSTCTRRVAVVLKELGIPYELLPVNFAIREHKSEAYRQHQPFGQIPYIVDDDGFELFESRAIGRYLAAKYPDHAPSLIPDGSDVQKLAKFEQAASIEITNFDPSASGIAVEKVFKPLRGETGNEEVFARHVAALEAKLDGYEAILSKQKYLAGDEVTLADLFHLPYGHVITNVGVDTLRSENWPNVARWWKDISSRPAWQAVKDGA